MKRDLCKGIICLMAIMAVMCSSPNDSPSVPGFVGTWIIQRSIESGITTEYSSGSADQILVITTDSLILYQRETYSVARTAYDYSAKRGRMFINTGMDVDTVLYRFEKDLLVFEDTVNTNSLYFAAYEGAIPPANWPSMATVDITGNWYLKSERGDSNGVVIADTSFASINESYLAMSISPGSCTWFIKDSLTYKFVLSATWSKDSMFLCEKTFLDTIRWRYSVVNGNLIMHSSSYDSLTRTTYTYVTTLVKYSSGLPPPGWPPVYDISSSGNTGDAYEPDDSYALAEPIAVNGGAQGHTLTTGDYDYVRFYAVSGNTYTIATHGSTDTYIVLYGANGTTSLASDDDDGSGYNALIYWSCTKSGTYYVCVRGNTASTVGSYSIDVLSASLSRIAKPKNGLAKLPLLLGNTSHISGLLGKGVPWGK